MNDNVSKWIVKFMYSVSFSCLLLTINSNRQWWTQHNSYPFHSHSHGFCIRQYIDHIRFIRIKTTLKYGNVMVLVLHEYVEAEIQYAFVCACVYVYSTHPYIHIDIRIQANGLCVTYYTIVTKIPFHICMCYFAIRISANNHFDWMVNNNSEQELKEKKKNKQVNISRFIVCAHPILTDSNEKPNDQHTSHTIKKKNLCHTHWQFWFQRNLKEEEKA